MIRHPLEILVLMDMQAQSKKSRLDGDEEAKYHQKFLSKAEIIVGTANRLWGKLSRDIVGLYKS